MNDPVFLNQWRKTADDVLAVLVSEESINPNSRKRFEMLAFDVGLTEASFPPKGSQIATWRVVCALRKENKPVTRTTIENHPYGGANIDPVWLSGIMSSYSSLLDGANGNVVRTNAENLKIFGEKFLIMRALEFATSDLQQGKESVDSIISNLFGVLSARGSSQIEDETADAQSFFDLFNMPPEPRILSGIKPIDAWTEGGLGLGEVVGIAAPEKSRKTSLVLNWARNYAEQGASVSVFMMESTIDSIKARFVSMFAVRWLLERGLYNQVDKNNFAMYSGLSGRNLLKARNNYMRWHPYRVQAINAGLEEFRRLANKIRFYDRSYRTGRLSDFASVERVLHYDKRKYGTQLAVVDHLQRITSSKLKNIFDIMTQAVNGLEAYARTESVSLLLLSQLNEDTKKLGNDANTVGSKGDGGALGAAVDYLYKLTYSHTDEPYMGYLTINAFLSREGIGGKDIRETVKMEPVSGLIFENSTPRKVDLPI